MKTYDIFIVGAGLAGSIVALTLEEELNCRVLIFDKPTANTASRVAAGLANPITGKRLAKPG